MLTVFGSTFVSITATARNLAAGAETILVDNFALLPSGRGANQALAAHLSGAKVRFASAVGHDGFGELAQTTLREKRLDLSCMKRIPAPTGLSVTLIDPDCHQQRIVNRGASGKLLIDDIPETWFDRWTTLLVQGEAGESTTMQAIDRTLEAEGRCILHLSPLVPISEAVLDRVDYLILNEMEALKLASAFAMRTDSARAVAFDMAMRRHGPVLIITPQLDLYIGMGMNVEHIQHPAIDIVDPLGADDALVGVFAAGISQGIPIADALHRAVAAAALSASREGLQTSFPEEREIEDISLNWPAEKEPERPSLRRRPLA